MQHYRIDESHGNAFASLESHGLSAAANRGPAQRSKRSAQLKLLTSPEWRRTEAGKLELKFPLPRQAVSLVTLRW